jgi:hypothetical protein
MPLVEGQGCVMGPVVKQFIVAQPYALANSVHTLAIDFTTADPFFTKTLRNKFIL